MSDTGAAPEAAPNPAPQPTPRRRFRRRRLAILILPLLLLMAAVLVTQIILSTDWPRRIALSRLEKETGLRITASSLSTDWTGHTILRDVAVALPLSRQPFLEASLLEVSHNTLLSLLLDRPLRINRLRLVKPRLTAQQTPSGLWDVAEAIELAARTLEQHKKPNSPRLEEIVPSLELAVEGGTAIITDKAGQTVTLTPLNIQGAPAGTGAWEFQAIMVPQLRITGRVAPAQDWKHQIAFSTRQIEQLLHPWLGRNSMPLQITGQWRGQINADGIAGRLELAPSQIGPTDILGSLYFQTTGSDVTITPESITAVLRDSPAACARLTGGVIHLNDHHFRADAVNFELFEGTARMDGQFDWQALTGQLEATWVDLQLPGDIRNSGRFHAALNTPMPNRPQITANLHTAGTSPHGQWNTQVVATGKGRSWSAIDWQLSFPEIVWSGTPADLTLKDLTATLVTDWPTIRLTALHLPDHQRLSGTGEFQLDTHQWNFSLNARGVPVPRVPVPVDVAMVAAGDLRKINLKQLQLQGGNVAVSAEGSCVLQGEQPLKAKLVLFQQAATTRPASQQHALAGGLLRGEARLTGTLSPLRADIAAQLSGRDVFLGKRQLGDLAVQVEGRLSPSGVILQSKELNLLDGRWTLNGHYAFADGSADIGIDVAGMPLKQVDGLLETPLNATGLLNASIKFDLPQGKREKLSVTGKWQVSDFKKDAFVAERATGRLSLNQQSIQLTDIQLLQKAGKAQAQVQYSLRDQSRLAVQAEFENWPIHHPELLLDLNLSGRTKLDVVATTQPSATGPLDLSASVRHQDKDLGTVQLKSVLNGRQLQVASLEATVLGATVTGQANLVFDDWLKSSASLRWRDLQAQSLIEWAPGLAGLRGTFAGSLVAGKSTDPHVTEPLSVQIDLQPEDAGFRGVEIGNGTTLLLLGRSEQAKPPSPDRIVVERCNFQVADGQISLWMRATTLNGSLFSLLHAQAEFLNLDFNQLVHAAEPNAEPMVGRLAGQVTIYGPRQDYKQLAGEARLKLTKSNLANSDIVAAFHRKYGQTYEELAATGTGAARLRVEKGAVELASFIYRVRGLEVRASGRLHDLFQGTQSPISGYAIGSAHPLREVKLPYAAEIDDILSALQTSVTTFRIGGILRDPAVSPAAFSDISQTFRDLLVSEFRSGSASE